MIQANRTRRGGGRSSLVWVALLCAAAAAQGPPPPPPPLPPVPVPPENPITPAKAVLGKMLFWEEQLSSSNTVACGTCHRPRNAGADPRVDRHPGADQAFNTPDDVFGSAGVIRSDLANRYESDPLFGLRPQVTTRSSPSFLVAAWAPSMFWDGRALGLFIDPQSGQIAIPFGGALESQAVGPPVSASEMAHFNRDWNEITAKLAQARPLALATNLPGDVAAALAVNPTYPALFQAAFGDAAINSLRIAFALATYQRTLRPDQTPHDRNQLTPNQQAGRQVFLNQGGCVPCHGGGTFTDFLFHNNGIRPWQEDSGRMGVTGNFADRGRFKTAQLRNVGLKTRFFHNGQFGTLEEVVAFYNRGGDFADNRDPRITPRGLAPLQQSQLVDFLRNGLTDPRVAAETPPFDRPTLWVERNPPGAELYGNDLPGSGGLRPLILARSPAQIPNPDFRIGVGQGLGGADALLVLAAAAAPPGTVIEGIPVNVSMAPGSYAILPMTLGGSGAGAGTATFLLPLPNEPALQNLDLFAQWFVMDPAAPGGIASATRGALIRTF